MLELDESVDALRSDSLEIGLEYIIAYNEKHTNSMFALRHTRTFLNARFRHCWYRWRQSVFHSAGRILLDGSVAQIFFDRQKRDVEGGRYVERERQNECHAHRCFPTVLKSPGRGR
ncbi:hypothetical protein PsorP6_008645 [Peronosclerospora sorghi]|uniref:Uncharacterized protein n=1 Tax=Peronosclerospora sorghi TaxID=230839 RepID=A0ACC0WB09_9STRA|nr:hypothetical protein PsorP6_008645 [Peronosclerospora sorghi]